MNPEELLNWAEKVRKAVEGESIVEMMKRVQVEIERQPSPPLHGGFRPDCGCPLYGTCMSTACPRRAQFICGTVRHIESPRSLYDHA